VLRSCDIVFFLARVLLNTPSTRAEPLLTGAVALSLFLANIVSLGAGKDSHAARQ